MKRTGIARNLDQLGRVTIPKEIRKQLQIEDNTPLELLVDDGGIYLKIYRNTCVFCKSYTSNELMGQKVCEECIEKIRQ